MCANSPRRPRACPRQLFLRPATCHLLTATCSLPPAERSEAPNRFSRTRAASYTPPGTDIDH